MSKAFLFFLFVIASFIVACSKDDSTNYDPDQVKYDLELELVEDASDLPFGDKAVLLADAINEGNSVSFREVTKLFVLNDGIKFGPEYKKRVNSYVRDSYITQIAEEHFHYISALMASSLKNKEFFSLKTQYESEIELKAEKKITLNYKASSTQFVRFDTQIHAASGTHLNLMASRMSRDGQKYRAENYVVLFSNGEMRPGRFVHTGDSWILFAIDTKSNGDAIQRVIDSKSLSGCYRVIDADAYTLVSALEPYLSKDTLQDLVGELEDFTAEKYGIDLDKIDTDACTQPTNVPFGPKVVDVKESALMPSAFSIGYMTYKDDELRATTGSVAQEVLAVIQVEKQQFAEMQKCQRNPKDCVLLPPVGRIDSRLYIRKNREENLVIPYVFTNQKIYSEVQAFSKNFALMMSATYYEFFRENIGFRCELLMKAIDLSRNDQNFTRYNTDDYEFLELHLEKSDDEQEKFNSGNFQLTVENMFVSTSIDGLFRLSQNGLLTLDGQQKQKLKINGEKQDVVSYVRGTAPYLSKEDLNRIELSCIRHRNGLPGSYR